MSDGGGFAPAPEPLGAKTVGRPRKTPEGQVEIRILADGVFIASDVRKDRGDTALVSEEIANILIERRHAKHV